MSDFIEIETYNGYVILVDRADYELVSQRRWHVNYSYKNKVRTGIISVSSTDRITRRQVLLHRFLLNPPAGMVVDHKNGNPLDNRRENLRLALICQNNYNSKKPVDNKSGFKGVYYARRNRKWVAQIGVNRKTHYLGEYDDPEVAHEAYKVAALKYHGEFSRFK